MGIFLKDAYLEQALLVSLGFFSLALLSWLLVQLIHWETGFQNNQAQWLWQLQRKTRQLRLLQRALKKAEDMPELDLTKVFVPPALRPQWRMAGWIIKALSAARWARS